MSPTPGGPLLHPQLRVQVRPPQEACGYEFVRDRLADPLLAEADVAIQVHRIPLVAVPVGGRPRCGLRRGGHFITEPATHPPPCRSAAPAYWYDMCSGSPPCFQGAAAGLLALRRSAPPPCHRS